MCKKQTHSGGGGVCRRSRKWVWSRANTCKPAHTHHYKHSRLQGNGTKWLQRRETSGKNRHGENQRKVLIHTQLSARGGSERIRKKQTGERQHGRRKPLHCKGEDRVKSNVKEVKKKKEACWGRGNEEEESQRLGVTEAVWVLKPQWVSLGVVTKTGTLKGTVWLSYFSWEEIRVIFRPSTLFISTSDPSYSLQYPLVWQVSPHRVYCWAVWSTYNW